MRYTYVRQHDTTDCAAACLAMVCLHYKKEVTITRLRDMMGTDLKGTNLVGLQKAANELGFTTAAVRVDRENFLSDCTGHHRSGSGSLCCGVQKDHHQG